MTDINEYYLRKLEEWRPDCLMLGETPEEYLIFFSPTMNFTIIDTMIDFRAGFENGSDGRWSIGRDIKEAIRNWLNEFDIVEPEYD